MVDIQLNDKERAAFHNHTAQCPCSTGKNPNNPVCSANVSQTCGEPEDCPMLYWLKVLGLLKLGVYELGLPTEPAPVNHNTRLNSAGN
ncbi:hypothetical protein LCGC14_0799430 [marine sediment metagenome]|uniref:Uncharacterized protein n=1 Tax=marine sediment metagenome TaxID=412755 RepID=A0A0F9SXA0_9ZZZZ